MNEIDEIVKSKFKKIKYVNGEDLPNSGTDYIYPVFCDEPVVQFYERGRLGYLFQFSIHDKTNNKIKKSCFVLHQRYSDTEYPVVYSGPDEFYGDCIVRDYNEKKFMKRFTMLINGETVGIWSDEQPSNFEFKLGMEGNEIH